MGGQPGEGALIKSRRQINNYLPSIQSKLLIYFFGLSFGLSFFFFFSSAMTLPPPGKKPC
jgi:hypothetical protein